MTAQRWRLVLARTADAPDLGSRELLAAWATALEEACLRDTAGADPARLVPGAPIPVGLTGDAELADLFLPERRTAADVRARLRAHLPAGYRLVDLHDVWPGEPPLPGLVVAGDYRVDIAARVEAAPGEGPASGPAADDRAPASLAAPDAAALRNAVATFLAADMIERVRSRPERAAAANLRPLVTDIRVLSDHRLWMRLRFDPALGTGRPDEVVTALGSLAGRAFVAVRRHRERLWLKGEEPGPPPA